MVELGVQTVTTFNGSARNFFLELFGSSFLCEKVNM